MQFPMQITYQHMKPSDATDAMIRVKLAKLERFYDRIVNCRVVVSAPTKPSRAGMDYQVRIDLTVPGGELVVNRESAPTAEPRHLGIALRDAFNAARRQLEDFARRQRGE
jgi:ribosome-associated translation inhibitor RaiA